MLASTPAPIVSFRDLAYSPIDVELDLLSVDFQSVLIVVVSDLAGRGISAALGFSGRSGHVGSARMLPSWMGPFGGGG